MGNPAGDISKESLPDWQQDGQHHIWMPYCQMKTAPLPAAVVATEGVHLVLADGSKLIDGLASWWSACHGYNHPHIIDAMKAQIDSMPHVMFGGIHHEPALSLASQLAKLLPGNLNRVFFSDSGSVAVEVAMKMAIQFYRNRGNDGRRNRFVSFFNAYHGDTTGAMSLCDPIRSMHQRFAGTLLQQSCFQIPENDQQQAALRKYLTENSEQIAGVFIEPLVQGAGGMKFHSPDVLVFLRQLCDEHDVLLIADELATGFGRTGSMFAIDQADIVPDIICLGKALTGGSVGLAATVASDQVFDAFLSDDAGKALMHGPTFMANPLACAAACASLDLFRSEPRLWQAMTIEETIWSALQQCRSLPHVVDVRCKGAIGVIQVDRLHQLDRLRQRFIQRGVWLRPFGDAIYMTPPLSISSSELDELCSVTVDVVRQWSHWEVDSAGPS